MPTMTLTDQELIASLVAELCPGCGKAKKSRQTFCSACYFKLPTPERLALYRRLGEGYAEAFGAALATLKTVIPFIP